MSQESAELAHTIVDIMDDRQASNIVMLDLRPVSLITDYFVIGTGESTRQINAILEAVVQTVKDRSGTRPLAKEGTAESGWAVLDYGGVVVHVFGPEERDYYDLEELWHEANLVVRIQ